MKIHTRLLLILSLSLCMVALSEDRKYLVWNTHIVQFEESRVDESGTHLQKVVVRPGHINSTFFKAVSDYAFIPKDERYLELSGFPCLLHSENIFSAMDPRTIFRLLSQGRFQFSTPIGIKEGALGKQDKKHRNLELLESLFVAPGTRNTKDKARNAEAKD